MENVFLIFLKDRSPFLVVLGYLLLELLFFGSFYEQGWLYDVCAVQVNLLDFQEVQVVVIVIIVVVIVDSTGVITLRNLLFDEHFVSVFYRARPVQLHIVDVVVQADHIDHSARSA